MKKYIPKIIGNGINAIGFLAPKYAAHLSIVLFSSPKKGKTNEKQAAYLKSAQQDELICNDIKIKTYQWPGKKDTILLAHGWESNTYRWKDLIELLKAEDYNVIALDAPAHGSSGGKLFNALIYSECIHAVAKKFKATTIIGHSVGGMATAFGNYNLPIDHVDKLVLLGAPADFTGVFSRYIDMMGYNKRVSKAMNTYVLKRFNNLPEYFNAAQFTQEFKAKGLIVHDKKDRIIPYKDGLKFKQNYANGEFVSTKGFGHGLKSDLVYNHILDFLNT
ncbi:alpha/beta hydrolase [Algibacter sp. TI.3.09]|uniref:alpha/beta fold hydrolase n=1 Tax=Algibacter sp. TI.3.09 TaxID=3121298 RepID=UPI00311D7CB8